MESKHKLSINQWALEDRPREKMMEKGLNTSDTRVSDKLYFHGKKVMDAIEEIFIGYIFFHLVECKSHFLFFP